MMYGDVTLILPAPRSNRRYAAVQRYDEVSGKSQVLV